MRVLYPAAFEGTWQVQAQFQNVSFPLGEEILNKDVPGVTKASMVAALPDVGAAMDSSVAYRARYKECGSGVVPDRPFNQRELLDAFLGYSATQQVEFERNKNPTRISVVYKTRRRDQSEQTNDLRKAELFINNCRFEAQGSDFYCAEAIRQVNQARQSGFVYDYEIEQHFRNVGTDHMQAGMRVAAFLIPQAPGFFKSQGQAVALYDYLLDYSRVV